MAAKSHRVCFRQKQDPFVGNVSGFICFREADSRYILIEGFPALTSRIVQCKDGDVRGESSIVCKWVVDG